MKGQRLREWGFALLAPVVGILPVPIAAAATYDSEELGQGLATLALLVVYGVPELLGTVLASWRLGVSVASPAILVPLAPHSIIPASVFYLLMLILSIVVAVAATFWLRVSQNN